MKKGTVKELFAPTTLRRVNQEKSHTIFGQLKTKKRLKLVLNYPGKEFREWLIKNHYKKIVTNLETYRKKGEGRAILPIPKSVFERETIYHLSIEGFEIKSFGIFNLSEAEQSLIQELNSNSEEVQQPNSEKVDQSDSEQKDDTTDEEELDTATIEKTSQESEDSGDNSEEEGEDPKNKVIITLERITKKSNKPDEFKPFATSRLWKKFMWAGIYINPQEVSEEICISTTQVSGKQRNQLIEELVVKDLDIKKHLITY